MTVAEPDVLDLLRAADPLSEPGTDDGGRLAAARRLVDAYRRRSPARPTPQPWAKQPRHRWWRVAAITLACIVAAPVVLVATLPGMVGRLGLPWPGTSVAVIGSELADRVCETGGHATAIAPSEANLRLWPGSLPAGWTPRTVFARDIDHSHEGCVAPSLVLAQLTEGRVVVGIVRVVGPREAMRYPGDPTLTTDEIAGLPAKRVIYPGMQDPSFHRWVLTGPGGLFWEVEAVGFTDVQARSIADQLSFTEAHVDYQAATAAPVSVLYRRSAQPYPTTTSGGLEWYVYFRDEAGHARHLLVRRGSLELPLAADEIAPGARQLDVNGLPGIQDGRYLTVEVQPGVLASIEVAGDLPTAERLLTSLSSLDPSDPRLRRYALREEYGD